MPTVLFFGLILAALWVFGFPSPFSNEVTSYQIKCNENTDTCFPFTSTTYMVNEERGVVTYTNEEFEIVSELPYCMIFDKENWTCEYSDRSGSVSFFDGIGDLDFGEEYTPIPRWQYRLEQVKQFVN